MAANGTKRAQYRSWIPMAKAREVTYPYFVEASTATLLLSVVEAVGHPCGQELDKYQLQGNQMKK